MDLMTSVMIYILLPLSGMIISAYSGLFNHVDLDVGMEHYAEPAWLPVCNIMPLNSLVNLGYVVLGLYWCGMTHTASAYGILKDKDSVLFYTFNISCVIYGCVQLLRIVTQGVLWSVLDQWSTLPFFSLLLVWGFYYQYGWCNKRAAFIMIGSLISYLLSLCFKFGFEISLGFHIVGAICGALLAYRRHPAQGVLITFLLALISCLGFVILKLLDHRLAELCVIFRYVSGHFLSKVCDIAQIHFVNNFFLALTLQKSADISVEKQKQYFQHCKTNGFYETNDIKYEVCRKLVTT
ncbi:unnamed protein product [Candidula unifasciata]|uniref:Transmembrane protein 187 n=1 Tax=Candidula unifasciata TaxID=100452 RepID=A0A8S4AC77_9EUPU|nr:unnamed protein product [Candidula unifasciata]